MASLEHAKTKLLLPDLPKLDPNATPEQAAAAEALAKFSREALSANTDNLDKSMAFIGESFSWLRYAYTGMMALGAISLLAAVISGLSADSGSEVGATAVLGGLSLGLVIVSLLTKPVESMERNAVIVPWMLLVLNTYWTRLVYLKDEKTIDSQLEDAAKDAAEQFKEIAEVHARALASETDRLKAATGSGGEKEDDKDGGDGGDDKDGEDGGGGDDDKADTDDPQEPAADDDPEKEDDA